MERVKGREGFTLIELAIVLVIIGLILGAVLKGQNLINTSRIDKVYTHFVEGWDMTVLSYQNRTGKLLGDFDGDGWMDGVDVSTNDNVTKALKAVGIIPPETNTGNPGSYRIKGKYVTKVVTLTLATVQDTAGNKYNVLYYNNMPTDVAIAIDKLVDGKADAEHGNFREDGATSSDWDDASTTTTVNCYYIVK